MSSSDADPNSASDTAGAPGDDEVVLDPWCVIDLPQGLHLFGFAVQDPGGAALSWMCSPQISRFDVASATALTRSGLRCRLGHRITAATLPDHEARLALWLAVLDARRERRQTLPDGTDCVLARAWLIALRVAREDGLEPPPLEAAALAAFFAEHLEYDASFLLGRSGS